MIDAQGDVYPCCFLYDDNAGKDSKIRKEYKYGSLRRNNFIVKLKNDDNELKKLLSKTINRYNNEIVPLEEEACNYCTRHFYQNDIFNELDRIVNKKEYKNVNSPYQFTDEQKKEYEKIWL